MDPLTMFGIQAGASVISGLFGMGQQSAANRAAEKQAAAQNKYNRQVWRYNEKTRKQQNKYNKRTVKIQRANQAELLDFQDRSALKDWQYQMQIRAHSYANEVQAYEFRKQTGLAQLNLNSIAADFAMQDLMRWENEQNVALDFEEKSTMMEFKYNQMGQALKLSEAEQIKQQSFANAQINQQKAYVASLKNKGIAEAKGAAGTSSEKVAAAAIAEGGLEVSSIIQTMFNSDATYSLARQDVNNVLRQINDKFYLDKAQLAASRVSLKNQGVATRRNIDMQKKQADLNAIASIGYAPSVPPAIPKPEALPRPIIQDPFKIKKAPKPVSLSPAVVSPLSAFASTVLPQIGSAAVSAFAPTTGNWNRMGNANTFGAAASNLNTSNITNLAYSLPRLY